MGSKIMFISKFVIVVLCFGLQIASCDRVRADGEKEERKKNKNPYYSKFEETAHLRPTRCQGTLILSLCYSLWHLLRLLQLCYMYFTWDY